MSQVTEEHTTRSDQPVMGGSHTRDLRFAGGVSAGLVSAILVGGALLAPVADWGGQPSARDRGETLTVRLPDAPRPAPCCPGRPPSTATARAAAAAARPAAAPAPPRAAAAASTTPS